MDLFTSAAVDVMKKYWSIKAVNLTMASVPIVHMLLVLLRHVYYDPMRYVLSAPCLLTLLAVLTVTALFVFDRHPIYRRPALSSMFFALYFISHKVHACIVCAMRATLFAEQCSTHPIYQCSIFSNM